MGNEVGADGAWAAGGGGAGARATTGEDVDDALLAAVEATVRAAVDAEVLPRWRALTDSDIARKTGPYDLVTTADRRAEEVLTRRLTALLPGSVVVGEEAVGEDPAVLDLLRGDAPVWVIDPVDGTAAFVRGEEGFSTLVALVRGGRPLASWTYAPRLGLFATARRGRGAHLDGRRLRTAGYDGPLRVWTSNPVYRNEEERAVLARLEAAGASCSPCRTSAGLVHLDVARGRADAVAFFWEAPWDHAAGLLLVSEAGGASLTAAGEPFRVTGGNALPFTVARDEETARRVIGILRGEGSQKEEAAVRAGGGGTGGRGTDGRTAAGRGGSGAGGRAKAGER
ncbi:inositol monophosphatase family protein [Streptomyces sp. HPF1205]|uniref:inositol monophosphatase family protein n=1 Tax=Streptomyces sp. HPF1205 TaxID=2873262 RepID=UPI001CEC61F7|nr:inositol monophosphatase family protein [Streptomyces sp. HPF1205]